MRRRCHARQNPRAHRRTNPPYRRKSQRARATHSHAHIKPDVQIAPNQRANASPSEKCGLASGSASFVKLFDIATKFHSRPLVRKAVGEPLDEADGAIRRSQEKPACVRGDRAAVEIGRHAPPFDRAKQIEIRAALRWHRGGLHLRASRYGKTTFADSAPMHLSRWDFRARRAGKPRGLVLELDDPVKNRFNRRYDLKTMIPRLAFVRSGPPRCLTAC